MAESGLRILSLDGGGVSVYSELLIIKELMSRIRGKIGHQGVLRPCEWFDMIGGTGGGGLVAVLLGRLRLDIDQAMECWLKVMRTVFARKRYPWEDGAFSGAILEEVMGNIVDEHCGTKGERMMEAEGSNKCKVVAYTLTADAIRGGIPTSIRSYRVYRNQGPECTIVEAVRATMANPGVFQPKVIDEGGVGVVYVGGGLACNNPTARLLAEVEQAYPTGQAISSVISIGSGQLRSARITNLWGYCQPLSGRLLSALEKIAQDCETVNQEMSHRFDGHEGYYRFNVDQGMQYIDQHSPEQIAEARAHTQGYLQEVYTNKRVQDAVATMIDGTGTMIIQGGSVFEAYGRSSSNHASMSHPNGAEGSLATVTDGRGNRNRAPMLIDACNPYRGQTVPTLMSTKGPQIRVPIEAREPLRS